MATTIDDDPVVYSQPGIYRQRRCRNDSHADYDSVARDEGAVVDLYGGDATVRELEPRDAPVEIGPDPTLAVLLTQP